VKSGVNQLIGIFTAELKLFNRFEKLVEFFAVFNSGKCILLVPFDGILSKPFTIFTAMPFGTIIFL
jgi:hypothetical protein